MNAENAAMTPAAENAVVETATEKMCIRDRDKIPHRRQNVCSRLSG